MSPAINWSWMADLRQPCKANLSRFPTRLLSPFFSVFHNGPFAGPFFSALFPQVGVGFTGFAKPLSPNAQRACSKRQAAEQALRSRCALIP